uniref:Uncharacterized protein n=1 Tax=Fagus sylvatica TaxID=28930 RepID=A0A2N9G1M5_FAGSY
MHNLALKRRSENSSSLGLVFTSENSQSQGHVPKLLAEKQDPLWLWCCIVDGDTVPHLGEIVETMQNLHRIISRLSSISLGSNTTTARVLTDKTKSKLRNDAINLRCFSAKSGENNGKDEWDKSVAGSFGSTTSDDLGWDTASAWSTGLTKEHFDSEAPPPSGGDTSHSLVVSGLQEIDDKLKELEAENRKSKVFVDGWGERMREMSVLLKQVREPGARGSYLKDSEKAEMYRLHKQNPEVYTVEKLAKDYRIMRQRVHAIL